MPNQDPRKINTQQKVTDSADPMNSGSLPFQTDLPPLPPEFQNLDNVQTDAASDSSTPSQDFSGNPGSATPPPAFANIASSPKKKFGTGKIIATILGILILIGGVGTGIALTSQKQLFQQKATSISSTSETDIVPYCKDIKTYDSEWKILTSTELSSLTIGSIVNFCVSGVSSSGSFDKARFTINSVEQDETTVKRPNSTDFCQNYTIPSGTTTFTITGKIHHSTLGWF